MSRRRTSNALKWSELMRLSGYQQGWFRFKLDGTLEIVQNSKEPPKIMHVVWAGPTAHAYAKNEFDKLNTNP